MSEEYRNTTTLAVARANGEKSVLATDEASRMTELRALAALVQLKRGKELTALAGTRGSRIARML